MDKRIRGCVGINDSDVDFLEDIEQCMAITADLSRADLQLCALLSSEQGVVASHAAPHSISSIYRQSTEGLAFSRDDQPLVFNAIWHNRSGRRRRDVLKDGAPIIQDVYPIRNASGRPIAALVVETNMIAHERQKRRNRYFRQSLHWLQTMCMRGAIPQVSALNHFGQYDGIYLVDSKRNVVYMSGTASNMFRMIDRPTNLNQQPLDTLESEDQQLVAQTFATDVCHEVRNEYNDGRTWVRKAIPLHTPSEGRFVGILGLSWLTLNRSNDDHGVDAVLVLMQNATEAVAKQRELEVKSAIIQEVHHRIKNNLQNVAAILRIQARRSVNEETKQHLGDAVNRVLSMSVIHEFLSHDGHNPINVRDVCQRIAGQVVEVARGPSQHIDVRVQGPSIRLPASQATPVALVLNELLMNAIEHGVRDRAQSAILVMLDDLGDGVRICVQDDGDGLPVTFDLRQSNSLGLQIVQTLVTNDLKGQFELKATPAAPNGSDELVIARGTQAIVTIPKRSMGVE